jgi:hypothetical protein
MTTYALIPRQGIYYLAIGKKTKFVALMKISRAKGVTPEEFKKMIKNIEITIKQQHHAEKRNDTDNDTQGK